MPNWCENDIIITADTAEELQEFLSYVREDVGTDEDSAFSFNKILPCDEVSKADVWGTKWSADSISLWSGEDAEDCVAEIDFLTAWTPPYGIYDALVQRFPNIDINWYYREEGERIAGYMHPKGVDDDKLS